MSAATRSSNEAVQPLAAISAASFVPSSGPSRMSLMNTSQRPAHARAVSSVKNSVCVWIRSLQSSSTAPVAIRKGAGSYSSQVTCGNSCASITMWMPGAAPT